ncbi:MAG: hypothetical protein ACYS8K_02000, partial [Planctomycetota bacterium]
MSPVLTLAAHEWDKFSVSHGLRLVGENQHLLGAGSIALATSLRLRLEVEETDGDFSLRFARRPLGEEEPLPLAEAPTAEYAVRWEAAIGQVMGLDASALAGLSVRAYFGGLWDVCPPEVLLRSPALATGLAVAVLAHRGGQSPVEEHVVAETACRLRGALAGTGPESTARFYAEVFLSIVGGAGYVEPGGRRLNVQQLLPPQSLLLALAPGID